MPGFEDCDSVRTRTNFLTDVGIGAQSSCLELNVWQAEPLDNFPSTQISVIEVSPSGELELARLCDGLDVAQVDGRSMHSRARAKAALWAELATVLRSR